MKMTQRYGLLFLGFLYSAFLLSNGNPVLPKKDFLDIEKLTKILDEIENKTKKESHGTSTLDLAKTYQFESVDALIHSNTYATSVEDGMEDMDAKEEEYKGNPKVLAAKKAVDGLSNSNLIQALTGTELLQFPIGMKDSVNGYFYSIVFHEATILPEYTKLKVYGAIQKEGGPQLMFGSDDIKFTSEGGFVGDATLALFADFPYRPNSKNVAFLFKGFERSGDGNHEGCYINFDCNGFQSARIDGDIIVTRDWILPTDQNGKVIPGDQRVRANVGLTVTDFNDFVINVTLPNFTLTRDTSVAFLLDYAVIDFSDLKNAPGFEPPPIYDPVLESIVQPPPDPELDNLWKGLYIKQIEVILPQVFEQDEQSLTLGAERLYIDNRGITGKFYVDDALTLERGKLGRTGWAFSLDRVEMSTLYSEVYEFGFRGRVVVPVGEEGQGLRYTALANIRNESYLFDIGVDSTMTIPMWKVGKVVFNENTSINVGVIKSEFRVQALICGAMEIEVKPSEQTENTDLKIPGISFEGLIIQDTLPYVSLAESGGHITFTLGPLLNNSILNVDQATISNYEEDKVLFTIGMEAGPMSEDDGGAKTAGSFGMIAKPTFVSGKQKWEFDGMKLMSLEIHLDFADAGYIKGGIRFFADDPTYGNGFEGHLEGGFVKSKGNFMYGAAASARFGTMNEGLEGEFKYWSFDVYLSFAGSPVTIYPPIAMNGFGGGMYHHMRMARFDLDAMADSESINPYSGIVYEPDENTRLGLKATMGLTTISGKAFQGIVTLELSFNQNLGLREIMIYGMGEIAATTNASSESTQDNGAIAESTKNAETIQNENNSGSKKKPNTITCSIMLKVSLVDGFLMQGASKVFLDAAEGKIDGEGALDFLVNTNTNKWHFYVGGYSDGSVIGSQNESVPPVTVKLNFDAFSVTASLYLMFGNDLPGPPPVKSYIAEYLKIPTSSNNRSKMNDGGRSGNDATGAAFGAGIDLDFEFPENADYSKIRIVGSAGFDFALLKNASDSRCSEVNIFPHGQKGWRAYGNLYMYVSVSGQWERDCSFCIRKWKIPSMSAGMLFAADAPNPSYFEAHIKIKIFSWLSLNVKSDIGEKCGNVIN